MCVLPTEAGRLTSTPAAVQRKEELKEEELRLIREIELITEERDELRDRLIYAREGAMNGRYALLQTLWCQSWV